MLLVATALAGPSPDARRVTITIDGDTARVVRAVPDAGTVTPGGDVTVVDADGRPLAAIALHPLATDRSVILPGVEGHGQHVARDTAIVRLRVPWPSGAEALTFRGAPLALPAAEVPPPVGGVEALWSSGPSDARLDLVFFAEGYRTEERDKFDADVAAVLDHLAALEPWASYRGLLNTWAVFVPSDESGIDQPDVALDRDSAFGCNYGCELVGGAADRLICCDDQRVVDAVDGTTPFADGVMLLVNETRYGGSGGLTYSTAYTGDRLALQVAAHELGHTLVVLWDEYGYGVDQDPEQTYVSPNCAPVGGPLPWARWLDGGPVDWDRWDDAGLTCDGRPEARRPDAVCAFPVCSFEDWVRPTQGACLMNTLQDRYCPVCREAIVRSLWEATGGEGPTATPAPGTRVAVAEGDAVTFTVDAEVGPEPLDVVWSSDGRVVGEGPTFTVTHRGGVCRTLTATVTDPTAWVRSDPDGALVTELTWPVAAGPCCGCATSPVHAGVGLVGLVPLVLRRRRR